VTEPIDLSGRRALVTGGASGIGRATAHRLAVLGAHVVVGDIDEPGGRVVADAVGAEFASLDVSDVVAWERVVACHGPFDIGFLNAGVTTADGRAEGELPVVATSDDAYRRIMSINVDGVVFGARALLADMLASGRGDLVVTASMAGLGPIAMDPIYGLTKHAVVGFVRSMAAAIQSSADAADICMSCICPGFTDTNILSDDTKDRIVGLGFDIMSPEHVADVVVRSIHERVQGAQWVVWPGSPVRPYEWSPAIATSETT
jgi:NAD(P)-dependent dehydrogenase (short-subunit alcohol dehydrogenase family)